MHLLPLLPSKTGRRQPAKLVRVPRGVLCAAAMVLSSFGCETTVPKAADSTALVTDGASFPLEREGGGGGHEWYRGRIPYTFTNRTGSRVYLPNCRGGFDISLEVEEAGRWLHAWSPILLDCLSPPIVIEPDEVYETTLRVGGCASGGNCGPRLDLPRITSAPVRILWGTGLSSYDPDAHPSGELIPLEERVSNSFRLHVSR